MHMLGHTHVSNVGDSVGDSVGDCVGDSLQLCRKMRTNVGHGLIFCKKANAYCWVTLTFLSLLSSGKGLAIVLVIVLVIVLATLCNCVERCEQTLVSD